MDPAQLQPGHRLDRYELLCPLAYGGMASVWLARFGGRRGFERLVVVKMILPQYSQDPRFQEMFLDEARIASRIEHPNVARILDVGEQGESTFIVMEWVDGDSLSKVARAAEQAKRRVPPGIALRVCADAAAGLHAAHTLRERDGTPLGVVHRDVSPQNILISNSGATVIIDFGVAKARDRVSQETSAGQLKGKIRYMAPEQALGRGIDHRADVWALGAILYELFAGVPPYDGPNEVATLHMLTSGVIPAPVPAYVAAPIRAVIERALAYEADARFATSLELNLALEACLVEIGEATSSAVVAAYTGHLLADRKAARKRAVDTALAAAYARDSDRASSMSMPVDASGVVNLPSTPIAARIAQLALSSETELASTPSARSRPSAPSMQSAQSARGDTVGRLELAEIPSATSSATLGSAAMEFPPREPSSVELTHKRRLLAAAVLGLSLAVGIVGAFLIVNASGPGERRPAGGTAGVLLPQESAELTPRGSPEGVTSATSAAGSERAVVLTPATTTGLAVATVQVPAPTPQASPSAPVLGIATHRVVPPAPPVNPKPKPTTPAVVGTGKSPERGF